MRKRRAPRDTRWDWLLLAAVVVIAMHHLPFGGFVAYPMMLLDTMAHEMGHGLTALAVGGQLDQLALNLDGSGVAHTAHPDGWPSAAVSAGGLLGPCLVAFVAFVLGRWERGSRLFLSLAGLAVFATMVLYVRQGAAWLFLVPLGGALLYLGLRCSGKTARLATLFLAIDFSLLAFTRSDYLFVAEAEIAGQKMTSDVGAISQALGMPYWFWGIVVALLSVTTLAAGLKLYLVSGPPGSSRPRPASPPG